MIIHEIPTNPTKLVIDGVDFTKWVAVDGIKWGRGDLDKDSGRTLDGMMHRSRVATKIRLDVTCVAMHELELRNLLQALMPVSIRVTYCDPAYGEVTRKMYCNNNSVKLNVQDEAGDRIYTDIEFPLIEY